MTPGTFSGGTDAQVQDDHLQVSDTGTGGWSWFKQALTHELTAADAGKHFRAFSLVTEEGLDSASATSAAIGPVIKPTAIGMIQVTVDDAPVVFGEPVHVVVNTPVHVACSVTGDADPTYEWAARGDYTLMVGQQGPAETTLTFPTEGAPSVTCTARDSTATDSPATSAMNFYVASQAEWDALHPQ